MNAAVMKKRRFHIFFTLRYLRYGLVLCLVPMLRALIAFDLPSLVTALRQDLLILLFCTAAALWMWWFTAFWVEQGRICIEQGVLFRSRRVFEAVSVAAVEIERPLHCRLFGAGKLRLYFRDFAAPKHYLLYLRKNAAQEVADALLPVREDLSVFAPAGFERLALVMLSANVLTSGLFIWMSLNRLADIFGKDIHAIAAENFTRFELWLEQFLPAGMAMLTALLFIIISVTFLVSLVRTAGFRVCRNGGVILSRGGLVTKIERRILVRCVSACDVRVTPVARVLGRYPVYLSAGSFRGGDIPVMVYRRRSGQMPETLLPNFTQPVHPLCVPQRKSIWSYLWKPLTALAVSLALCGAAVAVMPGMLPVLAVPVLLSAGALAQSWEGYFKEGVRRNENRTLSLVYTRFYTRHEICVFTPDVAYTTFQHPFSLSAGWADFTVSLPCGLKYRVRGVLQYVAHQMQFLQ